MEPDRFLPASPLAFGATIPIAIPATARKVANNSSLARRRLGLPLDVNHPVFMFPPHRCDTVQAADTVWDVEVCRVSITGPSTEALARRIPSAARTRSRTNPVGSR